MPEWKKAGGLVVAEPGYIVSMRKNGEAFVLLDLRAEAEASKGHIEGAVAMPADRLAASKAMFPEDTSAPIVLYGPEGEAEGAFAAVRGWGYRNAVVLRGGAEGWEASGGRLSTGPLAGGITYVKTIPKGQVGIGEFVSAVEHMPADKAILDVRDEEAAQRGTLGGAIHIPLAELARRASELPRDKEILIHCNTGIMASMARDILLKEGMRARYLNAVVQVDRDGSYEITEK